MNFFVLGNKLFIFLIVFTINVLLADSNKIKYIYKLARLNEDYELYTLPGSGSSSSSGSFGDYENKFSEKLFYEIQHNLDYRRIPKQASSLSNYGTYFLSFKLYCDTKYKTPEVIFLDSQNKIFVAETIKLKKCILEDNEFLVPLQACFFDKIDPRTDNWSLENKNEKRDLFRSLITSLDELEVVELHKCMGNFVNKMSLIDPKKKKPKLCAAEDVYKSMRSNNARLEESLLEEWLNDFSFTDYKILKMLSYDMLTDPKNFDYFKLAINIRDIHEEKERLGRKCLEMVMSEYDYYASQMNYEFVPQPNDTNFKTFIDRIIKLNSTIPNDTDAKDIYDNLYKTYIVPVKVQTDYFNQLLSIRAIQTENDYTMYAIRISKKGYYPLTKELWLIEQNNLQKYKKYIEMEANYFLPSTSY